MKYDYRLMRGLFLILFITFMAPSAVWAIDDPAVDYHTITTPHFYVHYDDGLEGLAKRTAIAAEEAHAILSPLLDWVPRGRTHINVVDRLDTANGWANSQGRNQIAIYGMPPTADSVLGYYDDWLRILVYHEYVHTLHMDTNPGIPQLLNYIVGKQVHPNQILPRWYVEGIATYFESARTGTGRVNSPYYWMWLRTAALGDRFFDLGQSSGLPVQWPSGGAAYLYGGFFMDFVARRHGDNFIRDFNHIYGARIVPFALNHTAKRISGDTFHEMWMEWTAEAQGRALAQRVTVRAFGESPLQYLTRAGGRHQFMRRRPGTGEISYYRAPQTGHAGYSTITPAGEIIELFDTQSSPGATSWAPDGKTLYLSRATVTKGVYTYQDLFRWNVDTRRLEQLTRAERAREPTVSPDGKTVAYVRNRAGTTELVMRTIKATEEAIGEAQVILGGRDHDPDDDAHWQQISTPTWTPDGTGIVFSWWRLDTGRRDLWLVRPGEEGDQRLTQLTNSSSHDMDPSFGPDGLLYFSSDLTGIFNIFAMDTQTLEAWQVSNVVTGVFSPVLSLDGQWLYASVYDVDGFELARFRRPSTLRHGADFQQVRRERIVNPDVGELDLTPGPYRPSRWLRPLTFMPDLGLLQSGAGAAATIEGYDPIGHHSYTLSGGWTTGPNFTDQSANIGALYRYGRLPFSLAMTTRFRDYPRSQGLVAESRFVPFMERQYFGRLSAGYPLRLVTHSLSLSTSFTVDHISFVERPDITHEPGDIRPQEPLQGFFNEWSFNLGYGNVARYPLSISAERGLSAFTGIAIQNEAIGSLYNSVTFSYGADGYYPNPLLERHVFALQWRGATTRAAVGPRRQFSIGGHTPQDVLTSVIFQEPHGGFPVRGFPPAVARGDAYQIFKLQYRFPLMDFDQGFSTVPLYIRQLKGSLFVDSGAAYSGFIADADLYTGLGAEVQLDAMVGYYLFNTLRLGYARGLGEEGTAEFYMFFGGGY